jgi:hypothetical protein
MNFLNGQRSRIDNMNGARWVCGHYRTAIKDNNNTHWTRAIIAMGDNSSSYHGSGNDLREAALCIMNMFVVIEDPLNYQPQNTGYPGEHSVQFKFNFQYPNQYSGSNSWTTAGWSINVPSNYAGNRVPLQIINAKRPIWILTGYRNQDENTLTGPTDKFASFGFSRINPYWTDGPEVGDPIDTGNYQSSAYLVSMYWAGMTLQG